MAVPGTKPLKPIKFSLTNKNNVETYINFAPDGWDESQIQCTRTNYYSVSEKVTTQLSFVKDGATILKNIFYTDGFESYCLMKIYQLNSKTGLYKVIYSGEIDFSTFEHEDYIVKCIANETDFWTKLKANESTEYEIDIDNGSSKIVEATFPYLLQKRTFAVSESNIVNSHVLGVSEINDETKLKDSESFSVTANNITTPPWSTLNTFMYVRKVIDVNITNVILTGYINAPNGSNFYLYLSNQNNTNNVLIFNKTYNPNPTNQFININIPFRFLAGVNNGFLFLYASFTNGSTTNIVSLDGTFELNYSGYPPEKSIKTLTPTTVLNQLLTKINDGTSIPLDVTFLNQISDYLFTSGDAIRGLTDSKLKLSFKQFFEYLDSKFCVGFGFENGKATLRERVHFYDNSLIYDLGEVRDLSLSIHKIYISNTIQIGTKEQTYDDVNGRYEFNQQQNWNNGIKKIKKLLDLSTDIRDDVYGIIFTSLNLEGKSTTDSKDDNDTFCLHTKLNGLIYNFNRDYNTTTVVGFPDRDNLFNYKLSPKRCLLRNSAFLATFLHNNTNDTILDSALKNSDFGVKANDEAATIVENVKLLKSELNSALYQPYLLNFVVPLRTDLTEFINLQTNGYFQFTWKGEIYKGFIEDLSIKLSRKSEATVKLISHSTNDLTKLI